jgi:hypothetical protein
MVFETPNPVFRSADIKCGTTRLLSLDLTELFTTRHRVSPLRIVLRVTRPRCHRVTPVGAAAAEWMLHSGGTSSAGAAAADQRENPRN